MIFEWIIARRRGAIIGLVTLATIVGIYAAMTMPVSIFPEVAFHRVGIIARHGSLPVDQTLTTLTEPLESELAGVLGLERIRSQTTRGGVEIDLRFGWDQDMSRALQLVQSAVDQARTALPAETEIETRPLDSSAFPVVGVAVRSRTRSLAEISDFVRYEAAPELRTIPGVYRVETRGAKLREYTVTLDPAAVTAHRLTLAAIEGAIRGATEITAAGRIHEGHQLVLASVTGRAPNASALLDVTIPTPQGVPVPLRTIARVDPTVFEDFMAAAANGEPAVLLGVSRQPGGNTVDVSNGVRTKMRSLARAHPDLQFSLFYDQADLVNEAVASAVEAIAIGIVLAVATIFVFIGDARTTAVAAAVVPITVLVTMIALRALGMSLNLMTLGAIAAGVGLVIDDAIVVIENFHRHRGLGQSRHEALSKSVSEIAAALFGSTLTPVAVLLPLCFLGEVPGAFFRPLAITLAIGLVVSLLLALTFTPALAAAITPHVGAAHCQSVGERITERLARVYERSLRFALGHRAIALAIGAVLVAVACVAYEHLETGFVPEMDEGAFVLDYWAPPGTATEDTVQLLERVDAILRETPEVASFSRQTGAELGFFLTEANRGDYAVRLKTGPRRPIEKVIAEVRRGVESQVPALRVEFVQILQDMLGDLSGVPEPIEVKIIGADLPSLEVTARKVAEAIGNIEGVVDVFDGITDVGPSDRFTVDDVKAGRAGLDAQTVEHWLETAVTGTVVGRIPERDRAIPIRLRYPEQFHTERDAVTALNLVTPQGAFAPLAGVARIEPGPPMVKLERENLRQLLRVTARLEGRDLGSGIGEVRRVVAKRVDVPPGVRIEYGGLYASQQRAFLDLVVVLAASAACVAAVLLVQFGSFAATIAIAAPSALALTGSLVALGITGTPLNVSSIVGMVMVIGIVAKNGILLVDFAERAESHAPLADALVEAGRVRLRPILMTSFAAAAGLVPLALGIGAGGQMQQPLAIAILGGLSTSMMFSLFGVPLALMALGRSNASAS